MVNFAAGGVATPADAALMMQLGVDGVFVGSGIFKSGDPAKRARAIVQAVTHYNDPQILAEVSEDLGEPMVGINIDTLAENAEDGAWRRAAGWSTIGGPCPAGGVCRNMRAMVRRPGRAGRARCASRSSWPAWTA